MMNEDTQEILQPQTPIKKHGPWYLLTGLILGFLLGVIYTWWINPVIYESTNPASLREDFKDTYRVTIAQVFAATGDLDRAARRLEILEDENPIYLLGAQAQRALAKGEEEQAHDLALLASELQAVTAGSLTQPTPLATDTMQLIPTQTLPALTPVP